MLTIEFEPPNRSEKCACCGGNTTMLTRFVHQDDAAYAVYYATFSDNHPEQHVIALISIGSWGDKSTPADRSAFCVRIWSDEDSFNVGLLEAADSPWPGHLFIGQTLDRAAALKHPRIKEVFRITDHIVKEDQPVIAYLATNRSSSQG